MTRVFFDRSLHQTTSISYKKLNTNYLVYKTQSDFSLPPVMSWIKTCHTIPQFAGLNFVSVFLFICMYHHLLNSSPEKALFFYNFTKVSCFWRYCFHGQKKYKLRLSAHCSVCTKKLIKIEVNKGQFWNKKEDFIRSK